MDMFFWNASKYNDFLIYESSCKFQKKSLVRFAFPTVVSAHLEVWQYFLSLSYVTVSVLNHEQIQTVQIDKYRYGGQKRGEEVKKTHKTRHPKNIYWANQIYKQVTRRLKKIPISTEVQKHTFKMPKLPGWVKE